MNYINILKYHKNIVSIVFRCKNRTDGMCKMCRPDRESTCRMTLNTESVKKTVNMRRFVFIQVAMMTAVILRKSVKQLSQGLIVGNICIIVAS